MNNIVQARTSLPFLITTACVCTTVIKRSLIYRIGRSKCGLSSFEVYTGESKGHYLPALRAYWSYVGVTWESLGYRLGICWVYVGYNLGID